MLIRRLMVLAVAALITLGANGIGRCVIPHYINYQGVVTDANGITIDGAHDLTFKIYVGILSTTPIWTEKHTGATITDGLFNVILGTLTPLPDSLFASGSTRYMGIAVDLDAEMTPRMRITSVPWAFKAGIADSALSVSTTTAGWAVSDNDVYSTVSGNIGIGTSSPLTKLHVRGYNINLPPAALLNDYLTVEAGDAVMGLYSDNGGTYGSAVSLGEVVAGVLSNKWSLYRTTGASSRLSFSFGTDPSYAVNPAILTMKSTGVGIGTTAPARKLEINDTQAYLRLTSSSAQGSVLEIKSTPTDPGTWRGRIDFVNGSNGIDASIESYPLGFMDQPGMIFKTAGYSRLFIHQTSGNVGIGTSTPAEKLEVAGSIKGTILKLTGGSDIAEPFDVKAPVEIMKGAVLAIDSESPGNLKVADKAYDHCVAGVVSGAGDVEPALLMSQAGTLADGKYPVALSGRVYCWADASNGPIEPGDLLTTSTTPGHAMKVTDHALAQGAVLGKAMTPLREGRGLVLVLVSLQ
jgi:hypothetical protein